MKRSLFFILVALVTIVSCKKKDDNPTPTNETKALVTATSVDSAALRYLNISVNYQSSNTADYLDDMVKVYSSDTIVYVQYISPMGASQTASVRTKTFTKAAGYKILLVREYSNKPKDTLATVTGN